MMNHDERWKVAEELCVRMVTAFPDEMLLGGVYGSTARGEDTPHSDLEMFFVARDGCRATGRHVVLRGTALGYRGVEQGKLEALLRHPDRTWPFHMGVLSTLRPLHGAPSLIRTWLDLGRSVLPERFRAALETALPELVVESHGRVLSCRERRNGHDIVHAAIEVMYEMNTALCLLNGRWVTHDLYQGFVDAFAFPRLPERYRELIDALWWAREIDEVASLVDVLVRNYWCLLDREAIKGTEYQSVAALPCNDIER